MNSQRVSVEIQKVWLGRSNYLDALEVQNQLHQQASATGEAFLIGCEHPSVVTTGLRENPVRGMPMVAGMPVIATDRGGQLTIHSPGQLVVYPIFPLRKMHLGVREYICLLLKTTQNLVEALGVQSQVLESPAGLFTDKGKLAFVGVRVQGGVTRHGLSLNVSNDLELFKHIVPCGIAGQKMDRLVDHRVDARLPDLFENWSRELAQSLDPDTSLREFSSSHLKARSVGAVGSAFP